MGFGVSIRETKKSMAIQPGEKHGDCNGYFCTNGTLGASYEMKFSQCMNCHIVLCSICGHRPHILNNKKYFCSRCEGGIDIVIGYVTDAERVHFTSEEAHKDGEPLPEDLLIDMAYQKVRQK